MSSTCISIISERCTREKAGNVTNISQEIIWLRSFRKFAVTNFPVLLGRFIGLRFELAVAGDEPPILKVKLDKGGIAIKEVSEMVVSRMP